MSKHFRVKIEYGKGEQNSVLIDESELEIALYAFITEEKVLFKNGAVRGKDIISITEDWHTEMGWNPGYTLRDEDYAELKSRGILKKYTGVIAAAKEKVQYLMQSDQVHLVGKGASIPGITTQALSPKL